ncbi:hypothetical protein BGX26_000734 [Mortierella sp. AD094]|nr:hypothetical protein BGX26_000734 [Mortierella sp. AD094]
MIIVVNRCIPCLLANENEYIKGPSTPVKPTLPSSPLQQQQNNNQQINMSNITERVSNTANSYIGGAKQTISETLGYPGLAASGAEQKAQADSAQAAAVAKPRVEGASHQVEGKIEQTVGSLTNDASLEARGHANEVRGNVESKV